MLQQHKLEGEGGERGEKGHTKSGKTQKTYEGSVKFTLFCDCLKHSSASFRARRTRALVPDVPGCFEAALKPLYSRVWVPDVFSSSVQAALKQGTGARCSRVLHHML